jgi:hypothetical protein
MPCDASNRLCPRCRGRRRDRWRHGCGHRRGGINTAAAITLTRLLAYRMTRQKKHGALVSEAERHVGLAQCRLASEPRWVIPAISSFCLQLPAWAAWPPRTVPREELSTESRHREVQIIETGGHLPEEGRNRAERHQNDKIVAVPKGTEVADLAGLLLEPFRSSLAVPETSRRRTL